MMVRVVFVLLVGTAPAAVHGADIFQWEDENGRTHYGDVVPDRYKQQARKVAPGAQPTPEAAR